MDIPCVADNVCVHNNYVKMRGGQIGIVLIGRELDFEVSLAKQFHHLLF